MKCPSCGFENKSNVKFCGNCGSALQNTCPNCGTVNAPGARFCTSCGHAFGAASPAVSTQPVVVLKQGTSGWVWALIGILLGVIVIGGLVLGGILPLSILQTATPTSLPTTAPVIASTKTPKTLAPLKIKSYCPKLGGVILYWNAGFNCENETGDLGFRQRVGDGVQDLNTGGFDNQASAIQIPPGWSVRLYEDARLKGASACFNSSISNFEERGNFPDKNIPINDNVSSMAVFRDGTCGEDLAKGAEPAPWPKVNWPKAQKGVPGMEAAAPGCEFISACPCLPAELKEMQTDGPNVDNQVFNERYFKRAKVNGNELTIELKDFADLFDQLATLGIQVAISYDNALIPIPLNPTPICAKSMDDPGGVTCTVEFPQDIETPEEMLKASILLYSRPDVDGAWIETCLLSQDNPLPIEQEPNQPEPVNQCTNPKKPQVCGDLCCKKDDKCVQRGEVWKCDKASGPSKQCESWDTCCLNPSFPGCP